MASGNNRVCTTIVTFGAVCEIVDSPDSHLSNSAKKAENPRRAAVLPEAFPGSVGQGVVLVLAKEFRGL